MTNPNIKSVFSASRFDARSLTTTPIRIFCGSESLGHASGFYWRSGTEKWLITNWHVVTGNNPFNGKALSYKKAPPTHLTVYDSTSKRVDGPGDWIDLDRQEIRIDLFAADGSPKWKQHHNFDTFRIDVVAIPLDKECQSSKPECVNECGDERLFHPVGADVFLVGYPLNNFEGWMLPIWKRGSLAGEPFVPLDNKPAFLIDVASSEGMSGSAVFRRVYGPRASADLREMNLHSVVATEFVGVYSGRLETKDLDRVNLAYAWYGYVVDEIVLSGHSGTTC